MRIFNLKGIAILAGLLLIIQVGVGLILSPILGASVIELLNRSAGTRISAERISFWPLTMTCVLSDLRIFDPDDETLRIAHVKKASLRLSPLKLLSKQLVLSRVNVQGARIDLRGEPDGTFNVQKLARGEETEKIASKRRDILDKLKGRDDWFSRIYAVIRERASREGIERQKAEYRDSRKVERAVKELPRGRRVEFTTPSDNYIFQVRRFSITDSRVNIVLPGESDIALDEAGIVIRGLGVDPLKGARFDELHVRGRIEKDGSDAGSFSSGYSRAFRRGSQVLDFDLSAREVDLSAVRFLYKDSLPVNFTEGLITATSNTRIVDGGLDSKNSLLLTGHKIEPQAGQRLSLGMVPLSAVCDAMNKVDPIRMDFNIAGTVEDPQLTGFQDMLMTVIKPYLADLAGQVKEQGIGRLKGMLRERAGIDARDSGEDEGGAEGDPLGAIRSFFGKNE